MDVAAATERTGKATGPLQSDEPGTVQGFGVEQNSDLIQTAAQRTHVLDKGRVAADCERLLNTEHAAVCRRQQLMN